MAPRITLNALSNRLRRYKGHEVAELMDTKPAGVGSAKSPGRIPLSWTAAILLAISLGLCAGYLDLLVMVSRKHLWDEEGYFRTGRDFLWTVPAGHAVLLVIAAVLAIVVSRIRRRVISAGGALRLLASLAIWGVLLRLPLHGLASLLLAVGLGRQIGDPVAAWATQPRRARRHPGGSHWPPGPPGSPLLRPAMVPGIPP